MAEGGFLLKFNGKEITRCYVVAFDYDEWQYIINDVKKKKLPPDLKFITIEVEHQDLKRRGGRDADGKVRDLQFTDIRNGVRGQN